MPNITRITRDELLAGSEYPGAPIYREIAPGIVAMPVRALEIATSFLVSANVKDTVVDGLGLDGERSGFDVSNALEDGVTFAWEALQADGRIPNWRDLRYALQYAQGDLSDALVEVVALDLGSDTLAARDIARGLGSVRMALKEIAVEGVDRDHGDIAKERCGCPPNDTLALCRVHGDTR